MFPLIVLAWAAITEVNTKVIANAAHRILQTCRRMPRCRGTFASLDFGFSIAVTLGGRASSRARMPFVVPASAGGGWWESGLDGLRSFIALVSCWLSVVSCLAGRARCPQRAVTLGVRASPRAHLFPPPSSRAHYLRHVGLYRQRTYAKTRPLDLHLIRRFSLVGT